jgi:hypothetical protein
MANSRAIAAAIASAGIESHEKMIFSIFSARLPPGELMAIDLEI